MKDVFKIFIVSKEIYDDLKANPQEGITFLGKCRIRVKEIWKDIKRYKGLYQVSNIGNIKRLNSFAKIRGGHKRLVKEKLIKFYFAGKGYTYVTLSKGIIKHFLVHRLVAIAFIPNPENKPEVNHKNGVKNDCKTINLEWCTHSENTKHAFDTGLNWQHKGENNIWHKLTWTDVAIIRESSKLKVPQRRIATQFNVSHGVVHKIIHNKKWVV